MRRRLAVGVLVLGLHAVAVASAVAAQAPSTPEASPTITADRQSARVGERVLFTLTGWEGRVVTVSVCGNQALRGSQDCNMSASEARSLRRDGSPTLGEFPLAAPALPCPCVLRASSTSNDVIAFVPIEIIGHPIGPLVEPAGFEPLDLDVRVAEAEAGLVSRVRSALGGPTPYDVTVTLKNRSGSAVSDVSVSGALGRDRRSDAAGIEFAPAGDLAGGASWTDTARVVVPAPAVGSFVLTASSAGGGPSVDAETSIRRVPLLMIVLIALLVGDVTAIVMRWRAKRQDRDGDDADLDDTVVGSLGLGS